MKDSINPNNVFPRRNLPGEAENWGRTLENRIRDVERGVLQSQQTLGSQNRNQASVTSNLASQIQSLSDNQAVLAEQQQDIAYLLDNVVASGGGNNDTFGYSLSSSFGVWTTINTLTLNVPDWASKALINLTGVVYMVANTNSVLCEVRPVIEGTTGMGYELPEGIGASAVPRAGTVAFTRNVNVTGGGTITTSIQLKGINSGFHTGSANRRSSLNVSAIFTR